MNQLAFQSSQVSGKAFLYLIQHIRSPARGHGFIVGYGVGDNDGNAVFLARDPASTLCYAMTFHPGRNAVCFELGGCCILAGSLAPQALLFLGKQSPQGCILAITFAGDAMRFKVMRDSRRPLALGSRGILCQNHGHGVANRLSREAFCSLNEGIFQRLLPRSANLATGQPTMRFNA